MSFISKLLNSTSASRSAKESKQAHHKTDSATLRAPVSDDDESDYDGYALRLENFHHLHSDPVPKSFKIGSLAAGGRAGIDGSSLTVDVISPRALSSDGGSGAPHSSTGRWRSNAFDRPRSPMLTSGSLKNPIVRRAQGDDYSGVAGASPGAGTVSTSDSFVIVRGGEPPSVVRDGGAHQCWNLPWVQQKVTMCPYCQRPIRPSATVMVNASTHDAAHGDSTENVSGPAARAADRCGSARDVSDEAMSLDATPMDSDDDTLLEEEVRTASRAYCHCGHRVSGQGLDAASPSKSASPAEPALQA